MMRAALAALIVITSAGTQDQAKIDSLVKKLDSPDWVEQAQAAKELAKIGKPVLGALRAVMLSDSPSAKYWASMISDSLGRTAAPADPAPATTESEIAATPNPKGFNPTANDLGSLVFACNNPRHGPYEATFSRCLVCAKQKKFASAHLDIDLSKSRCTGCHDPHRSADPALINAVTHKPFEARNCRACHEVKK